MAGSRMVPIARAVATEDPQMAANRVQATTVTRPSEPRMPPSQAADTSTSAFATPPWRMNAAAMTNSGSDINAEEFRWSMMTCANPIIGWPDTAYSTAAQAPSTRKMGMPAARRGKNRGRKRMVAIRSAASVFVDTGEVFGVRDEVANRHAARVKAKQVAMETDQVAQRHQHA